MAAVPRAIIERNINVEESAKDASDNRFVRNAETAAEEPKNRNLELSLKETSAHETPNEAQSFSAMNSFPQAYSPNSCNFAQQFRSTYPSPMTYAATNYMPWASQRFPNFKPLYSAPQQLYNYQGLDNNRGLLCNPSYMPYVNPIQPSAYTAQQNMWGTPQGLC